MTFLVAKGTSFLGTKNIVFVPAMRLPIPWANLPNSLAKDVSHVFLSGPCIKCRYSSGRPVNGLMTALAMFSVWSRKVAAAAYRDRVPLGKDLR